MLSVLIVNWNTRDFLRACLFSLQSACVELEYEIIVVDNASRDNSADMVRREFPTVLLLANNANRGYAAGNNQAYAVARGEYLWLLNPDTEVLADAARQLLDFLDSKPRCGAVASALIDARTRRPQRSCRTFPSPAALWVEAAGLAQLFPRSRRFGFYRMGWWRYHDAREVEQPMASSLLLRHQAVVEAGGLFDERFPIFFNDVDLCWRLRAARWSIWYLPQARVLHHGGASTRQARTEMIAESHRALRRFYHEHYRALLPTFLYLATVTLIHVSGAVRRLMATWYARH
jgi:GT2 family glycosyltransferase